MYRSKFGISPVPVGGVRFFPPLEPLITLTDNTQWLQTGKAIGAGPYPIAAATPSLQVVGVNSTLPSSTPITQIAINSSGSIIVLAINSGTNVLVSTDGGATFSAVAHNAGKTVTGVAYETFSDYFFCAGHNGAAWGISSQSASSVGSAWTLKSSTASTGTAGTARCYSNNSGAVGGSWCIVSGGTAAAVQWGVPYSSFTSQNLSQALSGTPLIAADQSQIAVSSTGATTGCKSTTLGTWVNFTNPTGAINGFAGLLTNSGFVALDTSGNSYTTSDLVTWVNRGKINAITNFCNSTDSGMNTLTYDGTRFIANSRANVPVITYSTDGITWRTKTTTSIINASKIVASNGVKIAIGSTTSGTNFTYINDLNGVDYVGTPASVQWGASPTENSAIAYVRIQ